MTTHAGPVEGWPTYMRSWRDEHPSAVVRNREKTKARARALTRLRRLHPEDFAVLYAEELLYADDTPAEPLVVHDCTKCGREHRLRS